MQRQLLSSHLAKATALADVLVVRSALRTGTVSKSIPTVSPKSGYPSNSMRAHHVAATTRTEAKSAYVVMAAESVLPF